MIDLHDHDVLTVPEAMALLDLERDEIVDLSARGVIKSKAIGKSRVFLRSAIEDARQLIIAIKRPSLLGDVALAMDRLDVCGAPAGLAHPGWLYALRCDAAALTKIGKAIDPVSRIAELARMNASPLRLLGLAHDGRREAGFHRLYATARAHGEWFAIDFNPLPFDRLCATCRSEPPR